MNPETDRPIPHPDSIHEQVKAGLKAHRLKVGILTTTAFVLGFAVLITSLIVVWCYPVFILPRQRELPLEVQKLLEQFKTNTIPSTAGEDAGRQIVRLLAVQIDTANLTTAGTAVVATAVGALGLGTLMLLTVVILNRRVALRQINASLAEISRQLRELQKVQGQGREGPGGEGRAGPGHSTGGLATGLPG